MSARLAGLFTEIDPPSLANPVLSFLKAYWDRKRGERAMPARADIKPAEIKEHLGSIVLVDVLPGSE
ncbi:MAG TPA: PAS domain-containing protein, partial [Rhizomicrobium sp.]|nr:PAS domain-containing protein [Rhizomicrobium sp.]